MSAALFALPFVVLGAKGAWDSIRNRVEDWLPETFEETQRMIWYYKRFGTDELLMISWPGCTLEDERAQRFREGLQEPVTIDGETGPLFRDVITGRQTLESLQEEPLELSERLAKHRLKGWLLGEDGEQTCVLAFVSPMGEANRHQVIDYVYEVADRTPGLTRDAIHVAGTTVDGVAIDRASKQSLAALNVGSFAVCIAIMLFAFRSLRMTLMVFTTAFFVEQLSMAIMYYSGQPMDSVLTLASGLTYVLAISAGVHLVNYYRSAKQEMNCAEATDWAIRAAWKPSLLSAITTSLGMISLTISQIRPVTNFGFYAAVSILAGTSVLLVLIPAELHQWPVDPKSWKRDRERQGTASHWNRLAAGVDRFKWLILLAAISTIAIVSFGVARIQTSVQLHDLFNHEARIVKDYRWVEDALGPLIPMEVVLRFPDDNSLQIDKRMQVVREIQAAVAKTNGIEATLSAATFAPPVRRNQRGLRSISRQSLIRSHLRNSLPKYEEMKYLYDDDGAQLWRISARVPAGERLDYGQITRDLRSNVETALKPYDGLEAIYCGSVPLVYKAQREMLDDLIKSFVLAFVLITGTMVLLLRSLRAGLLTMVPNVLPSLMVFGIMGWRGITVELGSMLTASAALGIAVDDSLHFITWYRRSIAAGETVREAARTAYSHCGAAMIQTSMTCSFGLLVFALSPFTPISRFAWLMFTLLLLALVCDLLILPAVLMCFVKKKRARGEVNS